MFHFYTLWKHQKTFVFLTFSGRIEKQHLANQLILDLIEFSLGMQIDIQKKRKWDDYLPGCSQAYSSIQNIKP